MSEIPQLPALPPLPDAHNLASLAATAYFPNNTSASHVSRSAAATPTPPASSAAATSSSSSSSTSSSPAGSSASAPQADASHSAPAVASAPATPAAGPEPEYYDAPGSTVRGSSVWQSIRLIRGDDDHVHCMRCGKDLKHNRTQARLTGTSNLSRHLRKCKGPPLPGAENGEEQKENGAAEGGSGKKRRRVGEDEGKEGEEKKPALRNGARASRGGAGMLDNGEKVGHHASLLQLQALHDAAITRLEQTAQQQQPGAAPSPQPEQLSSSELRRLMQWHSSAIARLQHVASGRLSEEWRQKAGKNFCKCCAAVESEIQLEPCKHVVWCRGCTADKCAVCDTVVMGKTDVKIEARGDG